MILRGQAGAMSPWQRALARIYNPHVLVLAVPSDASGLPQALASKSASNQTIAYLCRGSVCSAPLMTLESLGAALAEGSHR